MDEIDDYVYYHLPVQGVTTIINDYAYTSLFEFVKKNNKYYNQEEFKGSVEQHINYSFFKVLDKCNSNNKTITVTANGQRQTFKQFKQEMEKHKKFKKVLQLKKQNKKEGQENLKYEKWKNNEQKRIKQYNDTLKISISSEQDSSCVLYLTDSNWNTYKEEEGKLWNTYKSDYKCNL